MKRTTTRRVAVRCGDERYREVTVKLEQEFHPTTRKLVKTKEIGREDGRLCRAATDGEKADIQLVDAETFDVLMLVEAEVPTAAAAPETAVAVEESPPTDAPAPSGSEPEPTVEAAALEVEPTEAAEPAEPTEAAEPAEPTEAAEPAEPAEPTEAAEPTAVSDGVGDLTGGNGKAKAKPKKGRTKKGRTKAKAKRRTAAPKAKAKEGNGKGRVREKKERPRASAKGNGKGKTPSSGQSGAPLNIAESKLNPKEVVVLRTLDGGEAKTLKEMAGAFPDVPSRQANSWVRNALRRLVRGAFVEKVDRGSYRVASGSPPDPEVAGSVE